MQRYKPGIVKLLALSVVLALGAAACGSDDEPTDTGSGDTTPTRPRRWPRPRSTARAPPSPRASTRRSSPSSRTSQPRRHRRTTPAAARARAARTCRPAGRLRRHRRPGQGRGQAQVQGRRVPLRPDRGRAHHRLLQPGRRRRPHPRRRHDRQDLPAPDHQAGTTPPSRPSTPSANLPATDITVAHRSDGSGTTENFTKYLVAAAPGTWTLDVRLHRRVAGRHPGRQRQRRRGPDRQGHRRRHRLRRPLRRQGLRAQVRHGRRTRPARRSKPTLDGASAAARRGQVNADLTYNPLNADGDDVVPDHRPHLDPRLQEPDRQGQG